jgi:hypothetical protein
MRKEAGDEAGAEVWFTKAAEMGNASAMNSLGFLWKQRGGLKKAEAWYQRAAELGDLRAIENLAYELKTSGRSSEAEKWGRRGAEMGSAFAMNLLGNLMTDRGDVDSAEEWYEKASGGGNRDAMVNFGRACQNHGDFVTAELWFRQALEAGDSDAAESLASLKKVVESSLDLDAISFTTFGWKLALCQENVRAWREDSATLTERYFDIAPDFTSFDEASIRESLLELQEYVASTSFDVADLEVPEQFGKFDLTMIGQTSLLEVESFKVGHAKCIGVLTRHRSEEEIHFAFATFVIFQDRFWMLGIELVDEALAGKREGEVARLLLDQIEPVEVSEQKFDPYERKWDGLIPIEDDPLTRIHILSLELRNSIRLGEPTHSLEPFVPDAD